MSNDYQTVPTERLNKLIGETQQSLDDLKQELARRQQMQQEHEIANLEDHMHSAELSLKTIRNFLAFLTLDREAKKNED